MWFLLVSVVPFLMILRKMTKEKIECEHELFLNQSNSLSSGEQKELLGSLHSHCSHLWYICFGQY